MWSDILCDDMRIETYLLLFPGYLALYQGISFTHTISWEITYTAEISWNLAENQLGLVALPKRQPKHCPSRRRGIPDRQVKVDIQTLISRVDLQRVRGHRHPVQVDIGWSNPLQRNVRNA
jgi:hypothetical protein